MQQSEELAAASAWCRQYAIVNAAGLRKIAKKHDKYCGGSAGSRFLQVSQISKFARSVGTDI